jgi:uncharacterized protein
MMDSSSSAIRDQDRSRRRKTGMGSAGLNVRAEKCPIDLEINAMRLKTSASPVCIDAAGVQVQAEDGRIRCDVSQLVEEHGDSFMHRFLDRTLRLDSIQAVSIDRAEKSVTIEYDAATNDLGEALQGIAGALRGERPTRVPDLGVAVDFSGVAGSVTRVDRVHQLTGEMSPRTVRSGGFSNWLPRFARGRKAAQPSVGDGGGTRAVLHGLVVHYAPFPSADDDLPGEIIEIPDTRPAQALPMAAPSRREVPLATGLAKLANLAAAGGCFLLSVVGVVTPGIPTIPFVLATSYFLVRSTPELNERFRESRMFGQLVRDWEDSGGLRRGTKVRAIVFMFVLIGFTVRTATSLPLLALTGVMATIDLWVVLRLPTIPEDEEPHALAWQPA